MAIFNSYVKLPEGNKHEFFMVFDGVFDGFSWVNMSFSMVLDGFSWGNIM